MKGFKAEFKAGRIPENKSPDHNELRKPACDITFNIQIRLKSNSKKLFLKIPLEDIEYITYDGCEELAENIPVLESNSEFEDNIGNIGHYEGQGVGQTEVEYLESTNTKNESEILLFSPP